MDPNHQLITHTIASLTQEWLEAGKIQTIREIGDGLCEDFAEEAIKRIHAAAPHLVELVHGIYTDDWWLRDLDDAGVDRGQAICFEADIPRLRKEGAPLPDDISDEDLSLLIGQATHMWIEYKGMHFDATAPDGTAHFLLMPFFSNQIEGYRSEKQGTVDAERA